MKKLGIVLILCLVMLSGTLANADQAKQKVVLEDFVITLDKATLGKSGLSIRMWAEFATGTEAGEYVFFMTPWDDDTGEDLDYDGVVEHFDSWWTHDHACYISFKTADGKALLDHSLSMELKDFPAKKQADGTWRRELTFEAPGFVTEADELVLEFHIFNDDTPYAGPEEQKIIVKF